MLCSNCKKNYRMINKKLCPACYVIQSENDIASLKDKLSRRNMQIKDLKKEVEALVDMASKDNYKREADISQLKANLNTIYYQVKDELPLNLTKREQNILSIFNR